MERICLAVDKYFSLPQVINHLSEKGIGVVGTSRMRKGLSSPALRKIQQKGCDFSKFRYLADDNGTLISQYMDNSLVLLVKIMHCVGKPVLVNRRQLHITVKIKRHIECAWKNPGQTFKSLYQSIITTSEW
eukprot:2172425-Ditylum_brightwellii.AAC.1